jgi:hypothetical protein
MAQPAAEIGEARVWAIYTANQVQDLDLTDGLSLCDDQATIAADLWERRPPDADEKHPTQARTCVKFAERTTEAIDEWVASDGQALPVRHPDFSLDISPHVLSIGSLRFFSTNYNPNVRSMRAAVQRLRVVRLALPEVLRLHKPGVEEANEAGLAAIYERLGKISLPPALPQPLPRSMFSFSERSRWFPRFDD